MRVPIDIITCPQWGARKPAQPLTLTGKAHEIIFHHTAGHHHEIENPQNESRAETIRYARDIQNFHMDVRGWGDTGQNFLVCRNGDILQGRWLTVSSIEAGHMVISAHCPGKNDQIGIEHEHNGVETMTSAQRLASAQLQAWIAAEYGRSTPLMVSPHKRYFNTECPANLVSEISRIARMAATILRGV